MTNAMGGAHLHTPPSIFQHMMGQQNVPQQSTGSGGSWTQMPQVPPMSMPWSIPALQQPELIRFTGERLQPNYALSLHQKRKHESPELLEPGRPTKQFITEERMAAHFQDMHISANYHSQNPVPSTSSMANVQPVASKSDLCTDLDMEGASGVEVDQVKNTHPRLILSEELKRLQQEPILPSSLLSKLERPTMALVLWEPANKHLRILPTPRNTSTSIPNVSDINRNNENNRNQNTSNNNNNTMNNNNNEGIPDLNQTVISNPNLEPMDL